MDTSEIKYDMLVRYGSHADGGEGCFGHRHKKSNGSGGYDWADDWQSSDYISSQTMVYDVEKFYGNVCKEIYFKPGAELRLQQRLTYEKAWVEKELVPNKWYLMSTPLKATYAGDMYVPVSKGRQETEAFRNITFNAKTTENPSGTNCRTEYPIYQRSWGLTGSKVYTTTSDIRRTDYSAYIGFPSVAGNIVEWSHTYNDVQVPYNNYGGFSIRANRKTLSDNALIRLPKADATYDYYQWDGKKPATGAVAAKAVTKNEADYGRLVFDIKSGDTEQWTIPLANLQAQGTDDEGYVYYLVGNPFMASIDMGKFFGYLDNQDSSHPVYYPYNPKLSPVYYTYEASTLKTVDATTEAGIIRPLQAFIVKCKADDKPENIVFNRWAITDGNYTAPTLYEPDNSGARRRTAVRLTASNGFASSEATVRTAEKASVGYVDDEDVTTLFDSNLSDVPVVFTVADDKAVSIDTRPALDVVPFGVACAVSDALVEVNIHHSLDAESLYVLDAVTGNITEVGEGSTVSVQPNDYGRYFLTTRGDLTGISETRTGGIVVSVRGREVTVKSGGEPLTAVRTLTAGGTAVSNLQPAEAQVSFQLQGGVYIIEAQTAEAKRTMKVVVK